jgi:hypothetical protein
MQKENLSIDITFNPCYFSLDSPFKSPIYYFSISLPNYNLNKLALLAIYSINNTFSAFRLFECAGKLFFTIQKTLLSSDVLFW